MKTSQDQLQEKVDKAREEIDVGGLYVHFKSSDKFYVVESIGLLEASEEVCVVYRALYGKGLVWVRTVEDFCMKLEFEGKRVRRFLKVD